MSVDKLRELALAATEGPWVYDEHGGFDSWNRVYSDNGVTVVQVSRDCAQTTLDAAYIAAANPTAILELLDTLREIGETVDEFSNYAKEYGLHPRTRDAYAGCTNALQAILDKL